MCSSDLNERGGSFPAGPPQEKLAPSGGREDTPVPNVGANYPRDLIGYGRTPPHAQWPGKARIAVQFVLNYEEGGENSVLHGDAGSEQFLSEMFNPASFPDRHLSMESIYEYGSRAGVWRLLREFENRKLPLTVFGVHGPATPPRCDCRIRKCFPCSDGDPESWPG